MNLKTSVSRIAYFLVNNRHEADVLKVKQLIIRYVS